MTQSESAKKKKCLDDIGGDACLEEKRGEFMKEANARRKKLKEGFGDARAKYVEAREALVGEWQSHEDKICGIRHHLERCHENWKSILRETVCDKVISPGWEACEQYRDTLGTLERCHACRDRVRADLENADGRLAGWETLAESIRSALDANKLLIDEICKLDTCEDRLFALYILHFELLPGHVPLGPDGPSDLDPAITDPARVYCGSECHDAPEKSGVSLPDSPWLVDVDDYECALAGAWERWRDVGRHLAERECECERLEEDIADDKQKCEDGSDPEKAREAARIALQEYDKNCRCKPVEQTQTQGA